MSTNAGVYKRTPVRVQKAKKQSILGLSYHLVSSSQRVLLVVNKCVFWPMGNIITLRHSISSLFTHKTICELKPTHHPTNQPTNLTSQPSNSVSGSRCCNSQNTEKDVRLCIRICLCVRPNLTNTNAILPRGEYLCLCV